MKSPFPGMDPYLEKHWEDVHTALIAYIRDAIQPQLSQDLIARMEEKIYVEEEGKKRLRRPDVRAVHNPTSWTVGGGTAVADVVDVDEPLLLAPLPDPIPERSVLIYDAAGNRIVTAIELLSPWNKTPGKALDQYLEKREKYLSSDANLVEIDLVRTGDWASMIGLYVPPPEAQTTYRITVSQPDVEGMYLYPIPLNRRLPTIKIPLRAQDTPAKLNLQELIEKAYMMGRYDRIDYTQPCSPPLVGAEKEFADQVIAAAAQPR